MPKEQEPQENGINNKSCHEKGIKEENEEMTREIDTNIDGFQRKNIPGLYRKKTRAIVCLDWFQVGVVVKCYLDALMAGEMQLAPSAKFFDAWARVGLLKC